MNILIELCVVTYKIIWSLVLAGLKWVVHSPEKSVVGQVCLITGAGGTLGRLFAEQFARRGASLVLWDINRQGNEKTAEKVREIYRKLKSSDGPSESEDEVSLIRPQVYTYLCDVGKREEVYQTAEKVRGEVGDVDILINIAAVISGQHLLDCPDQLIERTLRVNCHALFWTSKAFLPRMLERNSGHIVTVASSLGVFSSAGVEDYCAGKLGAVGFHESLSHELKALEKEGVKMTLVCPAALDPDLYKGCHIRKGNEASLFPPTDPDDCVRKATRAILTNEPLICTPRRIYTISFLKTILPFDAMVCMYRLLGVTQCMSPFQAHRKEVSNNNESNMAE